MPDPKTLHGQSSPFCGMTCVCVCGTSDSSPSPALDFGRLGCRVCLVILVPEGRKQDGRSGEEDAASC
jgi:hypothetical protein